MPAKKSTAKKSTAKKSTAKNSTAKKSTAKKSTAKKPTAKKSTAKKATAKKATAKKATAKKATARASSQPGRTIARRAATPSSRAPTTLSAPGRSGDLIVIDSPQVGSPSREGEVLEVIHGEVSVSYLVRWADGHQTLIAPKGGSARIVRSSKRA